MFSYSGEIYKDTDSDNQNNNQEEEQEEEEEEKISSSHDHHLEGQWSEGDDEIEEVEDGGEMMMMVDGKEFFSLIRHNKVRIDR